MDVLTTVLYDHIKWLRYGRHKLFGYAHVRSVIYRVCYRCLPDCSTFWNYR